MVLEPVVGTVSDKETDIKVIISDCFDLMTIEKAGRMSKHELILKSGYVEPVEEQQKEEETPTPEEPVEEVEEEELVEVVVEEPEEPVEEEIPEPEIPIKPVEPKEPTVEEEEEPKEECEGTTCDYGSKALDQAEKYGFILGWYVYVPIVAAGYLGVGVLGGSMGFLQNLAASAQVFQALSVTQSGMPANGKEFLLYFNTQSVEMLEG